jgi:hypothetical protein
LISEKIIGALRIVSERLTNKNVRWTLVGSLSLALQGVDVSPNDIDILSDKTGAYLIGDLLKDYGNKPVEFKEVAMVRSYLGEFCINEIEIEVMAEYQEKVEGQWKDLGSRLDSPILVQIGTLSVPVSSLLSQLQSYASSGREKDKAKVSAIRAFLKSRANCV